MKKLFLFSVVFTLILFGCDPSSFAPLKISDEQKARDSLQQENPKTIAETTTTKKLPETNAKKKNFTIKNIKFILTVPDGFSVSDYSKIYSGINFIEGKTRHSLHILVEEPGKKTFEDVKNEFLKSGDGVKAKALKWRKNGYEFVFQQRDENQDYMTVINRTFLLPVKNHYFVMNEIVESPKDYSLSPKIKAVADSLEIL